MRKATLLASVVVVALIAHSAIAFASGGFSGSFHSQIGIGTSFGALQFQTESRMTMATLTNSYKLDKLTLFSSTSYDAFGMSQQVLGLSHTLGLIKLNSRLTFSPLPGGTGSTLNLTRSTNNPTQQYNLGNVYFVDHVEIIALTLDDDVNTKWRVRVSVDEVDWEWVSAEITGNGIVPVIIPINALCRYIEIVAITGFVDESAISVEVSAQSLVTTARLKVAGLSLNAKLALATGGSSFTLTVKPDEKGKLLERVKFTFSADPIMCDFAFDSVDIDMGFSFACLEEVSMDLGFDCEDGFEDVEISVDDINVGIPWLAFDISITFSPAEKRINLSPSLEFESPATCITPYMKLATATIPTVFDGVVFYGIRVKSTFDNGITIEDLTYFDDIHHTKNDYWEMISISLDGDSCCGGGFDLEVATHFSRTSDMVFGWAETEFDARFGLGSNIFVDTYLSFTSEGVEELIIGLSTSW